MMLLLRFFRPAIRFQSGKTLDLVKWKLRLATWQHPPTALPPSLHPGHFSVYPCLNGMRQLNDLLHYPCTCRMLWVNISRCLFAQQIAESEIVCVSRLLIISLASQWTATTATTNNCNNCCKHLRSFNIYELATKDCEDYNNARPENNSQLAARVTFHNSHFARFPHFPQFPCPYSHCPFTAQHLWIIETWAIIMLHASFPPLVRLSVTH